MLYLWRLENRIIGVLADKARNNHFAMGRIQLQVLDL